MKNLRVEFEFPAALATQVGLNAANASQEIRQMLALFLYEHKRISLGKACELAGISYWEFTDLNRQWGIPIHYSRDELNEDLVRLADE
jgi:predicted HTH domain antitoxin